MHLCFFLLTVFLLCLLISGIYVSSPFYKATIETPSRCPLPLSKNDCETYANYFNITMTTVEDTSASSCFYDQNLNLYLWTVRDVCSPYACVCRRHEKTGTTYSYGTKVESNSSDFIDYDITLQEEKIIDVVYSENTTLQIIDDTKPGTNVLDVFFRKNDTFNVTSYDFVYTEETASNTEFRPILDIPFFSLEEAQAACSADSARCNGVNKKNIAGREFYTVHHMVDDTSSIPNTYTESEGEMRHQMLQKDNITYQIFEVSDTATAASKCNQYNTCFAHGLKTTAAFDFIVTEEIYDGAVCDSVAECEVSCIQAGSLCAGYSSFQYIDVRLDWQTIADVHYTGNPCTSDENCKILCTLDANCAGYSKYWKASAYGNDHDNSYHDDPSQYYEMSSSDCNTLAENPSLWNGGFNGLEGINSPSVTSAETDPIEPIEWLYTADVMCPSWEVDYPDGTTFAGCFANCGKGAPYGGCSFENNIYTPGDPSSGMRGCILAGQVGFRDCLGTEKGKNLWTVINIPNNQYVNEGYGGRHVCMNEAISDSFANQMGYSDREICMCSSEPQTSGRIYAHRFEEQIYKNYYYEYGSAVSSNAVNEIYSRLKQKNNIQYRYGVRDVTLNFNVDLTETLNFFSPVFSSAQTPIASRKKSQGSSTGDLIAFYALFFKRYVGGFRQFGGISLTEGTTLESATQTCSTSTTCEGVTQITQIVDDTDTTFDTLTIDADLNIYEGETSFKIAFYNELNTISISEYKLDRTPSDSDYYSVNKINLIITSTARTIGGQSLQVIDGASACSTFCDNDYTIMFIAPAYCLCKEKNKDSSSDTIIHSTNSCFEWQHLINGECGQCGANQKLVTSSDGSKTCEDCPPNHFSSGQDATCLVCPAGRFTAVDFEIISTTIVTKTSGTYHPNTWVDESCNSAVDNVGVSQVDSGSYAGGCTRYTTTSYGTCCYGSYFTIGSAAHNAAERDFTCNGRGLTNPSRQYSDAGSMGRYYCRYTIYNYGGRYNSRQTTVECSSSNPCYVYKTPESSEITTEKYCNEVIADRGWQNPTSPPTTAPQGCSKKEENGITYGYYSDPNVNDPYPCGNDGWDCIVYGNSNLVCEACGVGRHTNGNSAIMSEDDCEDIDPTVGEYAIQAATGNAEICQLGARYYDDTTLNTKNCEDCPLGKYNNERDDTCHLCGPQSYSDQLSQSSCKTCSGGKYARIGNTAMGATSASHCSVRACNPGEYIENFYDSSYNYPSGATSCKQCEAGKYQSESSYLSTTCKSCDEGKFSTVGSSGCTSCQPGKYADSTSLGSCKPCAVGKASNDANRAVECDSCAAGTYQDETGKTLCKVCPAGTSKIGNENTGITTMTSACNVCALGRAQPNTDQTDCIDCEAGYYQDTEQQATCKACARGTYSSAVKATSSSTCTNCPLGKYGTAFYATSEASCKTCGAGKYSDVLGASTANAFSDEPCKACGTGRYSTTVGAGSQSTCINCGTGKYSDVNVGTSSSVCKACAKGKYSSAARGTSASACQNCAEGSYNDETAQAACKFCPRGTFADLWGISGVGLSINICSDCGQGRYNDQTGRCVKSTNTDTSVCVQAASLDAGAALVCKNCGAGRYSTANRGESESVCIDCIAGKYSNLERASGSCTDCNAGYFSAAGASVCSGCQAGRYQNQGGQSSCTNCNAGKASDEVAATAESVCVSCNVGYFSTDGASVCSACGVGKYQNAVGQNKCKNCIPGKASDAVAATAESFCISCNAGFFAASFGQSSCNQCGFGQYQEETAKSSCKACGAGKFVSFTDIKSGGSDTYDVNIDLETCRKLAEYEGDDVGSVYFSDLPYGCLKCAHSICENDASGHLYAFNTYDPAKSNLCNSKSWYFEGCVYLTASGTAFKANNFVSSIGDYKYISNGIVDDAWVLTRDECYAWAEAKGISNVGDNTANSGPGCVTNAAHEYMRYNPNRNDDKPCGSSGENCIGRGICASCPSGQYQPNQVATPQCLNCLRGTYQDTPGGAQCKACPLGRFEDQEGSYQCKTCTYGRYTPHLSSQVCSLCPTGRHVKYNWSPTSVDTSCSLCSTGKYADQQGLPSCKPCAAGRFQSTTGQTNCKFCARGQYQEYPQQSTCKNCPAGRYNTLLGATNWQSQCQQCQIGRYQNIAGQQNCKSCEQGKYQPLFGKTTCNLCESGFYQEYVGQGSCKVCGEGHEPKSYSSGATSRSQACTACVSGRYKSNNMASCTYCQTGKYQDQQGSNSCKFCLSGRYQNQVGGAACKLCDYGQYASGPAQTVSCSNCGTGRYQDQLGSSFCKSCGSGKYQNEIGKRYCKLCPSGQYQNSNYQTSCKNCGAGKFSDVTGLAICKNCAMGKISGVGQTSCSNCPIGQYNDETSGPTSCKECSTGQFSNSFGDIMGISAEQTAERLESTSKSCIDCSDLDIDWYHYETPSETQGCSQSYINDDTYGNDIDASMGNDGPYTEFTATPIMINDQHYVVVHGGKTRDGVVLGQSWTYDVTAQAYLAQGTHASGKPTIYSTDAPTNDPYNYDENWLLNNPPRRVVEASLGARFAHSTVYIPLVNLLVVVGGKSDDSTWYNMEQVLFATPSTTDVNFRHCIYGSCTTHVNALTISERKGFLASHSNGQTTPTPPEARTYPALSAHPDKSVTISYYAHRYVPCDDFNDNSQSWCDCRDGEGTMFYMYGGYDTNGNVLDDLWEVYQECSREYTNWGNQANYYQYSGSTYWKSVTSATGHAIEHPIGRNIVVHNVFQASNGVQLMSYNINDDTSSVGVVITDSDPYISHAKDAVTWDVSDIVIDDVVSCDSSGGYLCQEVQPTIDYVYHASASTYIRTGYSVKNTGANWMSADKGLSDCFQMCLTERGNGRDCGYFGVDEEASVTWCYMYRFGDTHWREIPEIGTWYKMRSSTGSFEPSCRKCRTTFKYFPVFLEDEILTLKRTYDGGTGNHRYVHASSNKHPVTFDLKQIVDVSVDPATISVPPTPCTSVKLTVNGGSYPDEVYTRLLDPDDTTLTSGYGGYTQNFCLDPGTYKFQGMDTYGDGWNNGWARIEELPSYTTIMPAGGGYFSNPSGKHTYKTASFTIAEDPIITDFYIGFDFRMMHETYRPVHGGTLLNDVGYVLVNNGQVFVASRKCPDCDENMHSTDSIVECTGNNQPRGCYECPTGKYVSVPTNDMDRVICENCANGKYQDEIGKFTCKEPVAGTCGGGECCPVTSVVNNVATTSCTTCGTGKYSADGSACVACPAGQYQNENGATSCKACECGHYTNTLTGTGATSCTKCTGNTYTYNSRTACATCAAGEWARESKCGCDDCPRGKYYGSNTPGLSDACAFCPAGKHGDGQRGLTSASQCVNCPNGKYGGDRELNGVAYTPVYEDEYDCHWCPDGREIDNVEGATKWYEACYPCGHSPYHSNEHCNTRCGFGSWPRVGAVRNGVQDPNGIHCYEGALGYCCYRI